MCSEESVLNVSEVRNADPLAKVEFSIPLKALRELFRVDRMIDTREELVA